MPESERRLVAIMFTDLVGFSSLSQKNENFALDLLKEYRELIAPLYPKYGGNQIKTMGDGSLVEFGSALQGVRCAVDIQSTIHLRNISAQSDKQILLRIGIHLGDVVHEKGDVFGDAVNVASRIEPLASPGGICISQQVYDQIRNKFELPVETIGKPRLKNIELEIEVFRIVLPWERETVASAQTKIDSRRIAVLPFKNISPDPSDEYFADGLTEEVISTMSNISHLQVISSTSVMQYKERKRSLVEIGKELNAGSVLEGSVRKAGNRIRITVQLIDSSEDKHLFARSYDRELTDIFEVQSDIARRVAGELRIKLLPRENEKLGQSATADVEAYTFYLKGRVLCQKSTPEDYEKALGCFEQSTARDSTFALAYAAIAETYTNLGFFEMQSSKETFPKAKLFAENAIKLDESLPEAHLALGAYFFLYERNLKKAETEFLRALDSNPNFARGHVYLANFLHFQRRFDEAVREMKRAQELDPMSAETCASLGTLFLYERRYDEAISQFRMALEINPNASTTAQSNLGLAYVQKGIYDAGIREILKAAERSGERDTGLKLDLAYAFVKAGRTEDAQAILSELLQLREKKHVGSAAVIAGAYSVLGQLDKAFEWLEKANEEQSGYLTVIQTDFAFDNLRSDPRYQEMLKRVGFE